MRANEFMNKQNSLQAERFDQGVEVMGKKERGMKAVAVGVWPGKD